MHTAGPKKDYDWRLACPERAYAGGFRRIGVGALLGLAEWRAEARALAAHLEHLLRTCWRAQFTVSLPRLRPCAGEFTPRHPVADRDFIQLLCALRLCFPQVGIVLSTREPAALRDALLPLGITMMSAGSHTEPGGYTGQGREDLHLTVRGKALAPADSDAEGGDGAIRDLRHALGTRSRGHDPRARFRAGVEGLGPRHSRCTRGCHESKCSVLARVHRLRYSAGRRLGGGMTITINGEARQIARARNVAELIDELELPAPAILVEHNGLALRREEWPARLLAEGDRIELVRIVAGG